MNMMIKSLTGVFVLSCAHFAVAADAAVEKPKASVCKKAQCDKSKCKEAECDKTAAKDLEVASYSVSGMTCGACSGAISKRLGAIDGVTVNKVCHSSGCAVVHYDPKKVKKADLVAAINQGKFKITAEQITVPVSGMSCGKCSSKLTKALSAVEGVKVNGVCHKSGKAVVELDPAKGSRDAVVKAIVASGFKAE